MKILYGAGNFIGSNIQAARFIQNAFGHEVRIAAYYRNNRYLNSIDWCLDALYRIKIKEKNYFDSKFGIKGPRVNYEIADMIIDDILEWQPDLVISDCEYFTASISKILNITLWYCSSILQIIGIEHDRKELNTKKMNNIRKYLNTFPKGDAYLVYSPLCDISSRPFLKLNFEWVRPYTITPDNVVTDGEDFSIIKKAIPKGSLLSTGETSFVSDCLYSGNMMFVSPEPNDLEQNMNAYLLEWYGCALNIGRSKNIKYIKRVVENFDKKPMLSIQNWKYLHERLSNE
jgi:hypothetical protein